MLHIHIISHGEVGATVFCKVLGTLGRGGLCGTFWREPPCTYQPEEGGYVGGEDDVVVGGVGEDGDVHLDLPAVFVGHLLAASFGKL